MHSNEAACNSLAIVLANGQHMESHLSFFDSLPQLMSCGLYDPTIHESFDGTVTLDYGHGFDELVSFAGGFVEDELPFDHMGAAGDSPDYINAVVDGNAPVSRGSEGGREVKHGDDDSSGTTTRATRPRRDRSKTLVSERKRRGRMKDRLYELRSLVPNITKMDKASIIADAVMYVQGLQKQASKLAEEITILESSSKDGVPQVPTENYTRTSQAEDTRNPSGGKVLRVAVQEVGEGRLYAKVECGKGERVAASLYSAIESLGCFHLESSNLIISDILVLTLTLKVRELVEEINATTMKLWVMGALLKQGFEFDISAIQQP